ncbi:TIGR04222 domain-containing membrane protein [Streptomyces sp. NPDC008265]|uniref:TIGR04222 domain-containing membrane protein n=1 Tax=Streptomyces sp. NPDC008265 TaxID=3364824 RepID=UPI0036EC9E21
MWLPFLFLPAALLLAAGFLGRLAARHRMEQPRARTPRPSRQPLTMYEVAYLRGGTTAVAETAMAALHLAGRLPVTADHRLDLTGRSPRDPVQRAVLARRSAGNVRPAAAVRDEVAGSAAVAKVAERLVEQGLAVDPAREKGVREADGFEAATAMLAAILGVTAVIWSAVTGGPWHWLRPLLAFALLLCGWGVLHVLCDPRPRARRGSPAGRALCARAMADDSWEPRPDHATRLPARTRRSVAEVSRRGLDAVTLPALALAVVGGPRPVPEPPVRAAEDAGDTRSCSSPSHGGNTVSDPPSLGVGCAGCAGCGGGL